MLKTRKFKLVLITTLVIAGCCLLFDAGLKTALGVLLVGSAVAIGIGSRSAVRDPQSSRSEARNEYEVHGRMMFCIGCGASNFKHAKFCRNCGEEVQSIPAQNTEPGTTDARSEDPKHAMNDLSEELEEQTRIEVRADHVRETASSEGGLPVSHVELSENRREYAGLFQRLLAYLCDLTVVYLILFAAELSWGFAEGSGLMHTHITEDEWYLLFFPVLFCYMILSLLLTRTTVGKAILGFGIERATVSGDKQRPAFGRIVLRETAGRMLSPLFFGVGYWSVPSSPNGQAWSDKIGHSVIRRRPIPGLIRWSLGAFVCLALIADVSIYSWATNEQKKQAMHDEWRSRLNASGDRVRVARDAVNGLMSSSADNFDTLQDHMRRVISSAEAYDTELKNYQDVCKEGLRENRVLSDAERQQTSNLIAVADLRIQQAYLQRTEAERILSFDRRSGNVVTLRAELSSLDKQIDDLNKQAANSLSTN